MERHTESENKYSVDRGIPTKSGGCRTLQAVRLLVLTASCCGYSPVWAQTILVTQMLGPMIEEREVAADTRFEVLVRYSTAPARKPLVGLVLHLHYDSSKLTYDGFSDLTRASLDTVAPGDWAKGSMSHRMDSGADTDRYLRMAWVGKIIGAPNWPWPIPFADEEANNVVTLVKVQFTTATDFSEGTAIYFISEGAIADTPFVGTHATIAVDTTTEVGDGDGGRGELDADLR